MVAAAYPAAQLVQLGQAKLVGARHDDGVGGWYVNAGFNDGGAQQQVVALGDEVFHHALQFALGHLAVGHRNAGLGQQRLQLFAAVLNRLNFVV